MENIKFYFFIVLLTISGVGNATPDATDYACTPDTNHIIYTVKKDDSLGEILCTFGKYPGWGEQNGPVIKVAAKNEIKDPDLIYPGRQIVLPFLCQQEIPPEEINKSALILKEPLSQDAPARLPAATSEALEFNPYSQLSAFGTYNFYRIDSISSLNQSRALLLSAPSFGINLGWELIWSERFHSGVMASYTSVQMLSASQGTLLDSVHALSNTEMYFSYLITPSLETKFFAGYESQFFARSPQIGVATLDRIYQARYGLSLTPTLVHKGNLSLGMELGYSQSLPSSAGSYTIDKANRYTVAPVLRQKLKNLQLELKLAYQIDTQESSISTQKNTMLGLQFGVSFEVGK